MIPDYIYEYIDTKMSEKRRIHTYAVAEEAKRLAKRYEVDEEKAELAALFHDFYRGIDKEALNSYVIEYGLEEKYENNGDLAHGKIAALVMQKVYHITDQDVINAVAYHTTGRAGMSSLEKVLYLADAMEPNRRYHGVDVLRRKAYQDLDAACIWSLDHTINYIRSKNLYLDEDTIQARDDIKAQMKRKEESLRDE